MNDVTATDLVTAAAACRWPIRTFFGHRLSDEMTWRRLAGQATPGERAVLLRALGQRELLVVTEPARAHVGRYLEWRRARPWETTPPPIPKAPIHGDPTMLADVEAAVASLPPAVQYTVGTEAVLLVGGRWWRGWTGPPIRNTDRAPVFLVDGPDLWSTVAHEAAHRLLASPFALMAKSLTVQEEQQLVAYATREGWPVTAADVRADEEHRLIDVLVRAWTA